MYPALKNDFFLTGACHHRRCHGSWFSSGWWSRVGRFPPRLTRVVTSSRAVTSTLTSTSGWTLLSFCRYLVTLEWMSRKKCYGCFIPSKNLDYAEWSFWLASFRRLLLAYQIQKNLPKVNSTICLELNNLKVGRLFQTRIKLVNQTTPVFVEYIIAFVLGQSFWLTHNINSPNSQIKVPNHSK